MNEPVLVVDDNVDNLKLMVFLLRKHGYRVETAVDAGGALEALEAFRPRLILMDVQLPGMSGLELTQQLKADPATRDILIAIVTAYAMKSDEARALQSGADAYIPKPIDTRTLPVLLAEMLRRPPADLRSGA